MSHSLPNTGFGNSHARPSRKPSWKFSPYGGCSHTWISLANKISGCASLCILNSSLASLDMFTIGMSFLLCPASLLHYFTSRRPDLRSWISLVYMYGGGGRGRRPGKPASDQLTCMGWATALCKLRKEMGLCQVPKALEAGHELRA